MPRPQKYLTAEEFREWKQNDHKHLRADVEKLKNGMARINGTLWILVPLVIAILTIILVFH